jgi:hypothetical protein
MGTSAMVLVVLCSHNAKLSPVDEEGSVDKSE